MRKRFLAALCLVVLISSFLTTDVAAASSQGLAAFGDIQAYGEDCFSDVPASSWFASGVRIAYSKGIMDGKSAKSFDPDGSVTWAEAVTIAARLHSIYYGTNIPKAEGEWYSRYLNYAQKSGLLPSTCPENEVDRKGITRQELAGLYRRVLSDKDIPGINDKEIDDWSSIAEEFKDAVKELYAAGIFTGKASGFDPQGQTTRAEIATIISRLLCPALRVSFDSQQTQFTREQLGNFQNGGVAVEFGDITYYIYKNYLDGSNDQEVREYEIIARTDDGTMRSVYRSEKRLGYLSYSDSGTIYFLETDSYKKGDRYHTFDTLRSLDPKTGETSDVYVCEQQIEGYLFYGGQLYVAQRHPKELFGVQLVKVGPDENPILFSVSDGLYTGESLYAFNGKLYFLSGDDHLKEGDVGEYDTFLWRIDLETGELERVTTVPYSSSSVAYCGATAWVHVYGGTIGGQANIYRLNLEMPQLVEKVFALTGDMNKSYAVLYANGGHIYYQSTNAGKIWELGADGSAAQINEAPLTPGNSLVGSAVLEQCVLDLPLNDGISSLIMEQIDVILPSGEKMNYAQFFEKPNYVMRSMREEAQEGAIYYEAIPAADIHADFTAIYQTANGDLAVEYTITNGTGKQETLYNLSTTLMLGERDIPYCFMLLGSDISSGGSQVCTIIYPSNFLGEDISVEHVSASAIVRCLK